MTEWQECFAEWLPMQIEATQVILENTSASNEQFRIAQGAMAAFRKCELALSDPAEEFGTLWSVDEQTESEE